MILRSMLALLVVAVIAIGIAGFRWSDTPHGELDYRAALSLHLLSFEIEHQPEADMNFSFKLPVNLIYGLSRLVPKESVSKVEDIHIPSDGVEIPARIYWPDSMAELTSPPPVLVYYHGGGFVVGSVEIFDSLTRSLANTAQAIVISVDYRLAPKHPYPAAVNDAYAALQWAAANAEGLGGDPERLVIGGDSAGGNLSAVTALKALQENGPKLSAHIMYYPATDLTDKPYPSIEHFMDGYGLSTEAKQAFHQAYIGHVEDRTIPYLSPLYADSLQGLPPALILTAGFDPLTDSAHAYAERLKSEGVEVTLKKYPSTIHGFMSVELFSQREDGLEDTREFLQRVWQASTNKPVAVMP